MFSLLVLLCGMFTCAYPCACRLQKFNLRYQDIFVELPVEIHNSHLITSLVHQYQSPDTSAPAELPASLAALEERSDAKSIPLTPNLDNLSLSIDPFLEKNCDLLLDSIETHHTETNNYQYYQRSLAREQNKINGWVSKRKQENAGRAALKQPPLPEDEWQRLFKLPQEPSRLETMLNSQQVEQYSHQVDSFVSATTGKMFAVKGNLLPGETAN